METDKKCVEYNILGSIGDIDELIYEVNKNIQDGWQPQGGIVVVPVEESSLFQALLRFDE